MKKRAYSFAGALTAFVLAISSGMAVAAPVSDDDIARSQEAEKSANVSIADAELELANLSGKSTDMEMKAAQAKAESLKAQGKLADSIAIAIRSQEKANKAKDDVEQARHELGSVSQAVYRDSAANITSSFYLLGADSFNAASKRTRAFDTIANQADGKVKHYAALEEVARVLQGKADTAAEDQRAIADRAQKAEEQAALLADQAKQQVELAKKRRAELVAVLARQRGTTEALEAQRLADIETDRSERAAAAAAAIIASANADRFDSAVDLAKKSTEDAHATLAQVRTKLSAAEESGNEQAVILAKKAVENAEKSAAAVEANERAISERAAAERAAAEKAEAERRAREAREAAEAEKARREAEEKAAEEKAARERAAAKQKDAEEAAAADAAAQHGEEAASAPASAPDPAPAPVAASGSVTGQQLVDFGRGYLGTPYVWGGETTAGWDCSGFMKFIFNHFGISVPRVSGGYISAGYRRVSAEEAQPGDVLWWPGHVGMYTGNGMHIAAYNPAMGTQEGAVYGDPVYLRVVN